MRTALSEQGRRELWQKRPAGSERVYAAGNFTEAKKPNRGIRGGSRRHNLTPVVLMVLSLAEKKA
jgi:hypothetical protein